MGTIERSDGRTEGRKDGRTEGRKGEQAAGGVNCHPERSEGSARLESTLVPEVEPGLAGSLPFAALRVGMTVPARSPPSVLPPFRPSVIPQQPPHPPQIREERPPRLLAGVARRSQDGRRVDRRDHGLGPLGRDRDAPPLGHPELGPEQRLRGRGAERHDHAGLDQPDLLLQPWMARPHLAPRSASCAAGAASARCGRT